MRWELTPPRHVPSREAEASSSSSAWLAVAVRVRIGVPAWHHVDEAWIHWAAPLADDGAPAAPLRGFDPSGRAMRPGEPPGWRDGAPAWRLDEPAARRTISEAVAGWRPSLHRHEETGAVSSLGEDLARFRRRCLAPLRPLLRSAGTAAGAAISQLGKGIATRRLSARELRPELVRFGVVWLASGCEPVKEGRDAMVAGSPQVTR